jgi:hypothetical protein
MAFKTRLMTVIVLAAMAVATVATVATLKVMTLQELMLIRYADCSFSTSWCIVQKLVYSVV